VVKLRFVQLTYVEILSKMLGMAFYATDSLFCMKSFVGLNPCFQVFVTIEALNLQNLLFPAMADVAIFYT